MPIQRIAGDIIIQRGEELFDQKVKSLVTDRPDTDFVAIDVESSDFEAWPNRSEVMDRLLARHPEAQTYMRRVGFPFTVRFGVRRPLTSDELQFRRTPPGEPL